jgi:hypothetical protein
MLELREASGVRRIPPLSLTKSVVFHFRLTIYLIARTYSFA